MSLNRYPSYLDTSTDWLEVMPSEWKTKKLRHVVRIQKRIVGELGHDVLSITQRGLRVKDIESNEGQLSMDYSKYQRVEIGDFAMNHMDLLTGFVDQAQQSGVTSPDYRVFSLHADKGLEDGFLLRVLQNGYQQKIFYAYGQGSSQLGRWRLPTSAFLDFCIPVPPEAEQKEISNFLNRETAKIDALVAEQQQLIELLQDKRQSVISHAVTKGLRPNAPMKDSGVEWLGEVPEHWNLTRLDRLGDFEAGKAHEPFVSDNGMYALANARFISTNGKAAKRCDVQLTPARGEDILMVMSDLPNGRALARAYHVEHEEKIAVNQRVCRIRITRGSSRFYYYFLNRNPGLLWFNDGANQTHIPNAGFTKLVALEPPHHEQVAIAAMLDSLSAETDRLMDSAEDMSKLLLERRSALISAAVTGQIDVRGLAKEEGP